MYVVKKMLLNSSHSIDSLGGARISWIYGVVYIAVAAGLLCQAYIGVKTGRSSNFHVAISISAALMGLYVGHPPLLNFLLTSVVAVCALPSTSRFTLGLIFDLFGDSLRCYVRSFTGLIGKIYTPFRGNVPHASMAYRHLVATRFVPSSTTLHTTLPSSPSPLVVSYLYSLEQRDPRVVNQGRIEF